MARGAGREWRARIPARRGARRLPPRGAVLPVHSREGPLPRGPRRRDADGAPPRRDGGALLRVRAGDRRGAAADRPTHRRACSTTAGWPRSVCTSQSISGTSPHAAGAPRRRRSAAPPDVPRAARRDPRGDGCAPANVLPRHASSRTLGVSRNTVLQAYDRLLSEGYAVASGVGNVRRRTRCRPEGRRPRRPARRRATARRQDDGCEAAAARRVRTPHRREYPSRARDVEPAPRAAAPDFRHGEPAYADLPLVAWARLLGRRARRAGYAARLPAAGRRRSCARRSPGT